MANDEEDKSLRNAWGGSEAKDQSQAGGGNAPQNYLNYVLQGRKDLARSVTGGLAALGLIDAKESLSELGDAGEHVVNPQHPHHEAREMTRPELPGEGSRRRRTGTTREFGKVDLPLPSDMLTTTSSIEGNAPMQSWMPPPRAQLQQNAQNPQSPWQGQNVESPWAVQQSGQAAPQQQGAPQAQSSPAALQTHWQGLQSAQETQASAPAPAPTPAAEAAAIPVQEAAPPPPPSAPSPPQQAPAPPQTAEAPKESPPAESAKPAQKTSGKSKKKSVEVASAAKQAPVAKPVEPEPPPPMPEPPRRVEPSVVRDKKKLVVAILYPDESTRSIKYDGEGQVTAVRDKDGTSWINQGGTLWVQFLTEGKPTGNVWEGLVSVDPDGNYIYEDSKDQSRVIERLNGSRFIEEPNSGKIEVNPAGNIVKLFYTDGTTREFDHDENGIIMHIVDRDGTMLIKEGDSWQQYDAQDRPTKVKKKGEAMVDDQGNYVFHEIDTGAYLTETLDCQKITQGRDGYTVTEFPDGMRDVVCPDRTEMRLMKDGTIITKTPDGSMAQRPDGVRIETDSLGTIRKVHQRDKTTLEFDYDDRGDMCLFKDLDNSVWKRRRIDLWIHYAENGVASGRESIGSITVDEKGAVTIDLKASDFAPPKSQETSVGKDTPTPKTSTEVEPAQAKQSEEPEESSEWILALEAAEAEIESVEEELDEDRTTTSIEIDSHGKVVRIDYLNSTRKEFEYAGGDELIAIKDESGRSLTKNSDDTWTTFEEDGTIKGTSPQAKVTVDREGNLVTNYIDEEYVTVQRADCSALRIDKKGQLLLYLSPDKRKFRVTARGIAKYLVGEDDSPEDIAVDAFRLSHWTEPYCYPNNEEMLEQYELIAAANNIKNPTDLHADDELKIPIPILVYKI